VGGADGELREVAMEHDSTLFEREVSPRLECIRVEEVFNMYVFEL